MSNGHLLAFAALSVFWLVLASCSSYQNRSTPTDKPAITYLSLPAKVKDTVEIHNSAGTCHVSDQSCAERLQKWQERCAETNCWEKGQLIPVDE